VTIESDEEEDEPLSKRLKTAPVKTAPVKTAPVKPDPVKPAPVKPDPVKTAPVKPDPVKAVKPESVKNSVKSEEDIKKEILLEDSDEESDEGSDESDGSDEGSDEESDKGRDKGSDEEDKKPRAGSGPRPSLEAVFDPPPPTASGDTVEEGLLKKIRAALKLAMHEDTPEKEAAHAMRVAEKWLREHNLSQSQVLGSAVKDEETGIFAVHLRYTKTGKPATCKPWINQLAALCARAVDAKFFWTSHASRGSREAVCKYSFYGQRACSVAAADMFSVVFNMCQAKVAVHKVPAGEYARKKKAGEITCSKYAFTLGANASYLDGLVKGVGDRYDEEQRKDPCPSSEQVTTLVMRNKAAQQRALQIARISLVTKAKKWQQASRRTESFVQGRRDGKEVQLGQQVLA
jgi:hypothetical protein